jgi:hypothetical protein
MKFKPGCIYRHDTAKDLDIMVVKVRYVDKKRSKLVIRWIDMHTGNVRYFPNGRIDGTSNVEIQADDYKYWKRI